jgi:hypothetical protein
MRQRLAVAGRVQRDRDMPTSPRITPGRSLMRTRSFFSIRRDGMSRRSFPSQTPSPSCRCRQSRPGSTRSILRQAQDIWRFLRDNWLPSSPKDAPGFKSYDYILGPCCFGWKGSSTCRGKSCRSACVNGPTGHDQRDLVSDTLLTAQSFHGSNSASPAIATANGLKVCNTFVEAAWCASTSGSRR